MEKQHDVFIDESPLNDAIDANNLAQVKRLVEAGHPINTVSSKGNWPIHQAAQVGNVNIIAYLLTKQSPLDPLNKQQQTPLHLAAEEGHADVIKFLLEKKADLYRYNDHGETALQMALKYKYTAIINKMIETMLAQAVEVMSPVCRSQFDSILQQITKVGLMEHYTAVSNLYGQLLQLAEAEQNELLIVFCLEQMAEILLVQAKFTEAAKYASAAQVHYKKQKNLSPHRLEQLTQRLERIQINYLLSILDTAKTVRKLPIFRLTHQREQLNTFRQQLECELNQHPENIHHALVNYQKSVVNLLAMIFKKCLYAFSALPCDYALVGVDKLANADIGPFTALRYALLIENDDVKTLTYFRQVAKLCELHIISLGETPLNIFKKGSESPILPGFCLDRHGITPLGKKDLFELIGTPKQLAQFQTPTYFADQPLVSRTLKTTSLIEGSASLFHAYQSYCKDILQGHKKDKITPYQQQALVLLKQALDGYANFFEARKEVDYLFSIKTQLVNFPYLVIKALTLWYGLPVTDVESSLEALLQNNHLNKTNYRQLKQHMELLTLLRLKLHYFYQTNKDLIYHPTLVSKTIEGETVKSKEPVYTLSNEDYQFILKAFRLNQCINRYAEMFYQVKGKSDVWIKFNLASHNYAIVNAKLLERQGEYIKAEALYQALSLQDPGDLEALLDLNYVQAKLGKATWNEKLSQILKTTLKVNGDMHAETALALLHLGYANQEDGHLELAYNYCKQGARILEKLYQTKHTSVPTAWLALANIQRDLGNLEQAKQLAQDALKLFEQINDSHKDEVANCLHDLGIILHATKQYEEAITYFDKALKHYQEGGEYITAQVAMCLNSIGVTLNAQHKYKLAARHFEKAIAIYIQLYGDTYKALGNCYNNLGIVYRELKDYEKSLNFYEKALTVRQQHYGKSHIEVATILHNMASAYESRTDYENALNYYQQALTLLQNSHSGEKDLINIVQHSLKNCQTLLARANQSKNMKLLIDNKKSLTNNQNDTGILAPPSFDLQSAKNTNSNNETILVNTNNTNQESDSQLIFLSPPSFVLSSNNKNRFFSVNNNQNNNNQDNNNESAYPVEKALKK